MCVCVCVPSYSKKRSIKIHIKNIFSRFSASLVYSID